MCGELAEHCPGAITMVSMKTLGIVVAILLSAPVLSTHTSVSDNVQAVEISNWETGIAAPCLKWRPDILDFVLTGLKDNAGKNVSVPANFPWQSFTLVAVSKNGKCEVLVADDRLADRAIVSVAGSEPRDPIGLPNDQSGTYVLFEFKSEKKGERLFAGIILPLPTLERELRGVPQLHT